MVFVDQYNAGHTLGESTGIGKLDQRGASYFVDLHVEVNPREPNTRPIDWVGETRSKLFIDSYWYSDFINNFTYSSNTERQSFFDIIDYLFFNESTDKETYLSTNDSTKSIYVGNSLKNNDKVVEDNYYLASNITQKNPYRTTPYRSFQIQLSKGSDILKYQVIVYCDGKSFSDNYPNSKILSTSPPVSYHDMLYMDFMNDVGNRLNIATTTATFVNTNIGSGNTPTDIPTAALTYMVGVHDNIGNVVDASFTVLYKGNTPTDSQIRDAIRDGVLNSGEGSEDDWKDRLPSLFVNERYYLVPFWDNTKKLPDSIVYLGDINIAESTDKLQYILPSVDLTILENKLDYLVSGYNRIFIAAVPESIDPVDVGVVRSFHEAVPQYLSYSSTENNFNYMTTQGQLFTKRLTEILVMLNESTDNTNYTVKTDRTISYVAFVIDKIEFCVITPTSYTDSLRG